MFYLSILTLHIIFAGIWLVSFFIEPALRNQVTINKNKPGERKFISLYLKMINLLGITGATGILFTGILLVVDVSVWGFFQFTANHWLATKQVILVIILALIGTGIIPNAKKIREFVGSDLESNNPLDGKTYLSLKQVYLFGRIINILVLVNFILALTHRYFG